MEMIGKVFQTIQGQRRRCLVCEGLFTRDEAKTHATVPCQPTPAETYGGDLIDSLLRIVEQHA